ncbi:hypothetical protein [Tenacibaculum singaporense]|uniref:hypothetical protein n=1 Tax=Tenacibaculum singaporense TaxID=2358479 RepID=UPI000F6738CD|nr:hypothetical protein [Tenacibaculum singaporense]RSC96034.1 hypothetical protein EI424_02635 [Tenacibaculum singaporense]
MKIIISSEAAKKLTKKLNNHFKSVVHQPVTIEFEMLDENELDLKVSSVEGKMIFNTSIQKV